MVRKKTDRPWHLKITWTLSMVTLLLVFGYFYQSFQEMLKVAPVQVAAERIGESVPQQGTSLNTPDRRGTE